MNEELKKAIESIADKEGFKKKIEELNKLNLSKEEEQPKLMEIFKEFGIELSEESAQGMVELSDDDLENVVGGCGDRWFLGLACTHDIMSWIGAHTYG